MTEPEVHEEVERLLDAQRKAMVVLGMVSERLEVLTEELRPAQALSVVRQPVGGRSVRSEPLRRHTSGRPR